MSKKPGIRESASEWLEAELRRGKMSERTFSAYVSDMKDLTRWCAANEIEFVDKVDRRVLRKFQRYLAQRGLSPKTQARRFNAIRGWVKFCLDKGWLQEDPTKEVSLPEPKALRPRDFEVTVQMIRAIEGDDPVAMRDRALMEIMRVTQAKPPQLAEMLVENTTRGSVTIDGKRQGLPGPSAEMLAQYLKARTEAMQRYGMNAEHLWISFGNKSRGRSLSTRRIYEIVRGRAEADGISALLSFSAN